jgi:hypothetical protein
MALDTRFPTGMMTPKQFVYKEEFFGRGLS